MTERRTDSTTSEQGHRTLLRPAPESPSPADNDPSDRSTVVDVRSSANILGPHPNAECDGYPLYRSFAGVRVAVRSFGWART
jgi:hypothetical protein